MLGSRLLTQVRTSAVLAFVGCRRGRTVVGRVAFRITVGRTEPDLDMVGRDFRKRVEVGRVEPDLDVAGLDLKEDGCRKCCARPQRVGLDFRTFPDSRT